MKNWKYRPWPAGLMTALAGCALGLLSLYLTSGASGTLCRFYLRSPLLLMLNIVPFLLLALLFFGLTGRAWLAFALDGVVCLTYSLAAYWKWLGRSEPLYAEDVANLREGLMIGGRGYVTLTWPVLLAVLLVILGCLILAFFFRGRPRRAVRLGFALGAAGLCAALYVGVYTGNALYDTFEVAPSRSQWSAADQFVSRGGIYPFLHSVKSAFPKAPDGYRKQDAQAVLEAYPTDDIPQERKVHVIMTMLEAFCDFSDLTDAITAADPYTDYHALQAESYTGQLFTNIFAGGTVNTERCVLTGFSGLPNFRRPSWSYVRYFATQGYTCTGSHPGNAAFYSRSSVNRNLGFSEYHFLENYYQERYGGIASDAELFAEVASMAEEQMEAGERVFSFNVTYQNHGPYFDDHLTGDTVYVPQGTLADSDYYIVNNYLSGVADTGAQMRTLCDRFRGNEEPVVLVFFADHKPWLGEQSVTYAALGIDLNAPGESGADATYLTDYLIWANDAAKQALGNDFCGEGPTVSPMYLMNVLFEQCGWAGPSYMKYTDTLRAALPVISTHDWYGVPGALRGWDALDEATQAQLRELRCVQYYLGRDSGGTLPAKK